MRSLGFWWALGKQAEDVAVDGLGEEEHGGVDGGAEWDEEKYVPVLEEVVGRGLEVVDGIAHHQCGEDDFEEVFEREGEFEMLFGHMVCEI